MEYNQDGRTFLYTEKDLTRFGNHVLAEHTHEAYVTGKNIRDFNEKEQITRDAPHFWYMQKAGFFGKVVTILTVHISSNGFKYDISLPEINGKNHYRVYGVHQDLLVDV